MKDIKFRVWNLEEKKMKGPFNLLEFSGDQDGEFGEGEYSIRRHLPNFEYEDYPVMQYTGVRDKNGKEIFEGDIVSGISYRYGYELANGKQFEYRGVVRAPEMPLWAWMIEDKNGGAWLLSKCVHRNCEMTLTGEILGSEYENPELLK